MSSEIVFPHFPEKCQSLLCQHLTQDVFAALKNKTTSNGYTFAQAIHSGVENPDSSIGVYAGDAASYTDFAALFDPIIQHYHGFSKEDNHNSDFQADHLQAQDLDPKHEYIISTRIRVARNLADFPLGPALSKEQRSETEHRVSQVLGGLTDELAGQYFPLKGMSETDRAQLVEDHFLFKAGDRFLEAAGLNRDWPEGRGIFHNRAKTFLVWVNEEDQLRIISMQKGGDIKAVFTRLANAVNTLEERLSFLYSNHLGYLTSCPTNLGTAMRASVHIKLPHLLKNKSQLEAIAKQYHLQIRGIHGEHSDSEGGVCDVSNRRRLGVTEVQCVQDMYNGVVKLIDAEKSCS